MATPAEPMRKAPPLILWLAALAAVAVQAMALATRYYQPWLDGDYLLPERFAADVLSGAYPLSGWTLSSSPYFFPDFALSIGWRAVLGTAPLLPFYVVTSYVALALLAGWSLQRAKVEPGLRTGLADARFSPNPSGGRVPPDYLPWLLGALLVNALLAFQGLADHARWLWWLGTATFHGGAVLLGLAQFALWAGSSETKPSPSRVFVAGALLFLGLASDTLLLTQFVLPLGVALFATAASPRWSSPRLRTFAKTVVVAYGLVIVLRVGLHLAHWGNFPSVVRYAPTPSAIAGAAGRMATDLTGFIATSVPAFIGLFVVGAAGALWLTFRRPTATPSSNPSASTPFVIHYMTNRVEQRQAGWFAGMSLGSTLLLPALAVYWQNPQNGRYLLPCLVLPLWWLGTLLPAAKLRGPLAGVVAFAALFGLMLWRVPQVDDLKWTRPHPEKVAELERLLVAENPGRGLADFWNANYLSAVSSTLRLNQLRSDGRVQFWGNNAFHYFELDIRTGVLRPALYRFIIVNGLDPTALRLKFGEPSRVATTANYTVWLYDEAGAKRISALVDTEVRVFVDGRPGAERIE